MAAENENGQSPDAVSGTADAGSVDGAAGAGEVLRRRRRIVGLVTSDKMQKTVVVVVERRVRDPRFHKFVTRRVRFKAHDENNDYKIGDRVEIVETRPLSKDKRWRVARLIERPQEV